MGVDASYLYGYMAKFEDVEWDIDFLKEKFDLTANLTGWLKEYKYYDLIEWLENDEVDEWDDVSELLGVKKSYVYDQGYLYFTHFDAFKLFPERKLEEFDELVKEYARLHGVKNYEIFKWNEFGFFD